MNKKEFDRRMESAVGMIDPSRSLFMFILFTVIFEGFLAILYFVSSTFEPNLENNLINAYCLHEAPLGCFYIPNFFASMANELDITNYWLPWGFFVRQILLFPLGGVAYLFTWWAKINRQWKFYWFFIFAYRFSILNSFALFGEILVDFGLINFFWREVFAWCNLVLMLFMLTLSLWNRKLLEKLAVFEKVAMLVGGLGGGVALGVLLVRLFSRSKSEPSALMIMGLFWKFLIVVVSGMKFSQLL